jgi:glycogen operon protein
MMLAGDEVRRTQMGNNNAYCQDNEVSWFDWSRVHAQAGLLRFWSRMIEFRKTHAAVRGRHFFTGAVNERGLPDVSWHGCRLNSPGWSDPDARALAMTLGGFGGEDDIHVMFNMYWERLDFEVPVLGGRRWLKMVDTAAAAPRDIAEPGDVMEVVAGTCPVEGRSIVVLVSRPM